MLGDVEGEHRTDALIRNVGVQLAKMHRYAKRCTLPSWFSRPRYGLQEFHAFVAGRTCSEEERPDVERATARMTSAMEQMGEGRDAFGLIHIENGDGNVLARGDEVAFIDFRRFGWGHYMTDVQKMAHFVKQEERARLLAGYASVLPLPPRFDEHFAAFDEVRRVIGHFT
jgi:Ser/Thr protein kinase RdoA (MazF antagonist)